MKKIKIDFRFFPREAVKEDNFFLNFLNKNFEIEISKAPDFILFSNFSENRKVIPEIKEKAIKTV